jgi:hypothetical protein
MPDPVFVLGCRRPAGVQPVGSDRQGYRPVSRPGFQQPYLSMSANDRPYRCDYASQLETVQYHQNRSLTEAALS